MGVVKAVTTGIKCTSRIIPCVEVTAEDVAVTKIGIHFYKNVKRFNFKYERLQEISKDDNSRNTDILWKLSCLLYPTAPACNGTMQLVHHGEYPSESSINCLPMIAMDPTHASCIYLTLHFVADQAKTYGVAPVLTFDQPLWMKAQHNLILSPLLAELRTLFCVLGNYTWQLVFLEAFNML